MKQYKPVVSSLLVSLAFTLSPAITAGFFTFFLWEQANSVLVITGGVFGILSAFLTWKAVLVHMQRLFVDDHRIQVIGPLLKTEMRWSEVHGAKLMERRNAISRTDHWLILSNARSTLSFHTSTLSEVDEEEFLGFLRTKTNMVVEQSPPTV